MDPPHGNVSSLVALVVEAAKTIETEYAKLPEPYVPSLDDLTPHPQDSKPRSLDLILATQVLIGACAQLTTTVVPPIHNILSRLESVHESACLNVVLTFKIPDILLDQPQGMHISEIGKKTGVNDGKLGRILRLLVTKHIFREVKHNVFANNRISLQLISTNPLASLASHHSDEVHKSMACLSDVLADPDWTHSQAADKTAFNKAFNVDKSLFEWYNGATEEGAKKGARFNVAMLAHSESVEAGGIILHFPWGELPPGTIVCDVGGGIGSLTIQLAKQYPHLQLKLQDLPDCIARAKNEIWPKECPDAIEENRIEFKPLDFLTESPIKGCDVYFLKCILHDWSDSDCLKILRGVRNALKPTSRVLIYDTTLRSAVRSTGEDEIVRQAPEPLLPNYGVGGIVPYNMDLTMMTLFNGKERALDEFIELGKEAGLHFIKAWPIDLELVMEFGLGD